MMVTGQCGQNGPTPSVACRGPSKPNVESTSKMARILLLGPAREAAGMRSDLIDGRTVAAVLEEAVTRYGTTFKDVLDVSQIWVNGEPADSNTQVAPYDEIAVLPPISGG
jgi:molybdopterin synthase sulfur carrier subunit